MALDEASQQGGRSGSERIAPAVVEHAMVEVGAQIATIGINLDVMANRMCADCREQSQELLGAARQSLDLAGTSLDELGQRFDPCVLKPLRLQERFNDFKAAKGQLEQAHGIRIVLTQEVSENCVVLSNRDLARQVTRKLVENAAKAGASTVRIHYQELSESVEVVFADDGRGMSSAEAERLGLAGVDDDTVSGGHGAALVRRLVNRGGGTVSWDGRLNIGTWVTIRLRKLGPDAGPIKARWGRSAVPDKRARELEDDPQQAEVLNAAGLVHDVSNDLAAIGINLDLIGQRSCPECQVQLRALIDSTRNAMEAAKGSLESIGLRTMPANYGLVRIKDRILGLSEALDEMGAVLGVQIELTHDVSDACMVLVNREGGRLVTRKLIENAARAGAKRVRIHFQELGETVEAVFADDGHGMTAEEVEGLGFATYGERAASAHEVGLVRQLINRIGGTVFWDSRKNVGTWVTIRMRKYLPDPHDA